MAKPKHDIAGLKRIEAPEGHSFTYQYAQPAEYTFCQDSIIFPLFVAERLKAQALRSGYRALDVCAGCGVIGFELAHHLPALKNVDFLEIQDVFREPFERNLAITKHDPAHFRFLQINYESLLSEKFQHSYDLIVANPPYFHPNDGKLSPSQVKNRCRFFMDSSLEKLVHGIANALKPEGKAFLLVKSGERHGKDTLTDLTRWVESAPVAGSDGHGLEARIVADIRGTWVAEISDPNLL